MEGTQTMGAATTIVFLCIYFIPTIVAYCYKHNQKGAILLINLFFGWTFIGWIVALVMAVWKKDK